MELIIVVAIAFWVGYKVSEAIHTLSFRKILKELGITEAQLRKLARDNGIQLSEPKKEPQDTHVTEYEITIEQHGDELYAFKTDGEFVAQGRDQEALINRIAERYKNVKFTVRQGKEYLTKTQG